MEITLPDIEKVMLILARMTTLMVVMPIFGYDSVPLPVKAGLSILLTIIVFPFVTFIESHIVYNPIMFMVMIAKEVIVGLIISFMINLVFFGVQFAGQIVGIQIGFGIINVIDPNLQVQVSLIGQLNYMVALLVFLAIDGHLFLIRAMVYSFEYIPLAGAVFPGGLVEKAVLLSGAVFDIGIRVAAPVMVALFITDVALGITARVAPQMNVFIVGFPLKIVVGLLALAFGMSLFAYVFNKLFTQFQEHLIHTIRLMAP
ncbi:flagellar biosynthetic protein FliR [bacterium]|nr:flagellar biosynthetic protein FliR [bacterium]